MLALGLIALIIALKQVMQFDALLHSVNKSYLIKFSERFGLIIKNKNKKRIIKKESSKKFINSLRVPIFIMNVILLNQHQF